MTATMLWRAAKATSVTAAVAVVALLVWRPELGLFLTWKVLVPAVPALLLIAPQVWRNLCPIAVVHQLPAAAGRPGARRLPPRVGRAAPLVAGLLFFAIVPLRLAVLNEHGPALAGFVLAVLAVALVGGVLFAGKSGWCSTFCPVLPVERLYGQSPVAQAAHAHCATCSGCIRSCYDLAPRRSLAGLLGPARDRRGGAPRALPSILSSPTGVFAAGFPGFVLGYFTNPEAAALLPTYIRLAAFVAGSVALFAAAQLAARISAGALARVSGAAAVALYYWFTVPDVAAAAHAMLGIAPAPAIGIGGARFALLLLPVVWIVAAHRAEGRAPAPRRAAAGAAAARATRPDGA